MGGSASLEFAADQTLEAPMAGLTSVPTTGSMTVPMMTSKLNPTSDPQTGLGTWYVATDHTKDPTTDPTTVRTTFPTTVPHDNPHSTAALPPLEKPLTLEPGSTASQAFAAMNGPQLLVDLLFAEGASRRGDGLFARAVSNLSRCGRTGSGPRMRRPCASTVSSQASHLLQSGRRECRVLCMRNTWTA